MRTTSHMQPVKKRRTNKLVLGFAAVVASAVVGTTGFVAANGLGNQDKPTKEQCAAAGFQNYGQCVKEWAQNKNRPGGGYGGGNPTNPVNNTNVTANVGVEVNGNNNVISVILNLFR